MTPRVAAYCVDLMTAPLSFRFCLGVHHAIMDLGGALQSEADVETRSTK